MLTGNGHDYSFSTRHYAGGLYSFASVGSVNLGKLILTYSAERAYPIVGQIFESCAGLDTVFGVTYFRVINPIAYFAYIFIHTV